MLPLVSDRPKPISVDQIIGDREGLVFSGYAGDGDRARRSCVEMHHRRCWRGDRTFGSILKIDVAGCNVECFADIRLDQSVAATCPNGTRLASTIPVVTNLIRGRKFIFVRQAGN